MASAASQPRRFSSIPSRPLVDHHHAALEHQHSIAAHLGRDALDLDGDLALDLDVGGGERDGRRVYLDARAADLELDRLARRGLRRAGGDGRRLIRSEEHTSELQSLMRISYAVFCLKKTKHTKHETQLTYA